MIHAVGSSPGGPFLFSDVALPTWHHNPDIKRCPVTGEFVLYTISCFSAQPQQLGTKNIFFRKNSKKNVYQMVG